MPRMLSVSSGVVSVVGGVATCAGLLYVIRYLWGRQHRVSVRDKVVLITGASSGLGEACAHLFHEAGAKVILTARRTDELERVRRELQACRVNGAVHNPMILHLNLEDLPDIPRVAHEALSIYGHIDILINNAGISFRGSVASTTLETDVKLMTVNYFGQLALTKALLPSMVSRQKGHIVCVSSVQGRIAIPFRAPYAASKHACQAFFDSLRAEVSQHNIMVTVVSPAYIRTNLSLNAVTGDGSSYGKLDSTTESGMRSTYVARRILQAVTKGEKDLILAPLLIYIVTLLRSVWPSVYFSVMERQARKQAAQMEKKK